METLIDLLLGRRGGARLVPPPGPAAFEAILPEVDSEEELEDALEEEEDEEGLVHILGEALVITYENAKGEESRRRIALHTAYESQGFHYLKAYCFERSAVRCFRADRIREIVDVETGEVFESTASIFEVVSERADPLDAREATERAFQLQKQGILMLLFLARCDGEVHPSEEEVILTYIDDACGSKGVDEGYALRRLAHLSPDPLSYEKALKYLARFDPEQLRRVLRYARRLIEADGAISEDEARFAMAIDDLR